jgi:hypothetical protein
MTAFETFEKLEKGILNIIRAADIYAIYILHRMRQQPVPHQSIDVILKGNGISVLNLLGTLYTADDLRELLEKGHVQEIAQQILVATHTAFEVYLKAKFDEYYRFRWNEQFPDETGSTFRSIQCAKKSYRKFFRIHLNLFEIHSYFSTPGCNFQPKSSWQAITMIDKARIEIVHRGISEKYKMNTVMDSWYPFDFTRRWVTLFDANFDAYIYEGHAYGLVK